MAVFVVVCLLFDLRVCTHNIANPKKCGKQLCFMWFCDL